MFKKVQEFIALLTGNVVTVTVALTEKPVVVEDSAGAAAIVPGGNANNTATNDERAKAKLVELLNSPRYKFRSLSRLSKAIGRERWQTEELLADIGARPSRRNGNLFGLVSRVGQRQYA